MRMIPRSIRATISPPKYGARVRGIADAVSLIALMLVCRAVPSGAQARASIAGSPAQIVANTSRAAAPIAFRLGGTPQLDLGGLEEDPELEFDHRQGYLRAERLSNGDYAVIDVFRIHFFNSRGRRIRVVGKKGGGPGEFQYLDAICRTRGDTLVVADSHLSRFTMLTGRGEIVRSLQRDEAREAPAQFCFDDGTFVARRTVRHSDGRQRVELARLRTDGSLVNSLGAFESAGTDLVTQPVVSVVAAGAQLYFGDGSASEFSVYDTMGRLVRTVRSDDPQSRVASEDIEQQLALTIPNTATASQRAKTIARRKAMPHRAVWPAYRTILVDPIGRVWVQSYERISASPFLRETWAAFHASGRLEGRLEVHAEAFGMRPPRVVAFGNGSVMLRRTDGDGATHLVVKPVSRVLRAEP